MTQNLWRVDDLAQRAGLTVDTIRYYAREGLLQASVKSGKNKLYGPEHLERLAKIKELQEQRFNLASIRAIVAADRPGIPDLFLGAEHQYDLADLVAKSGLELEFVEQLAHVGLLADPATLGRQAYDDADLQLLHGVRELIAIGMTEEVLVELGRIYVRHFAALQTEVHALLAGWTHPEWDPAEVDAMQRSLTSNAKRMLPAVDEVLNYVHQRTVQRLTIDAIRTAAETGTGVGGVRTSMSPD